MLPVILFAENKRRCPWQHTAELTRVSQRQIYFVYIFFDLCEGAPTAGCLRGLLRGLCGAARSTLNSISNIIGFSMGWS